jgi:5S rRNA maturation endonuclease (ribonuclease M5)
LQGSVESNKNPIRLISIGLKFSFSLRNQTELESRLIDSLSEFIRKLNSEVSSLVIVEGPRDARALRSSGFTGNIFMLCHHQNLRRLVEKGKNYRKFILLLDGDREGRQLAQRTEKALEGKVRIDMFYARALLPASGGRIRHVEELSICAPELRRQSHSTQEFTTSTSSSIENGLPM